MKRFYFVIFILLFSSLDVFSQKHFNNWYFGWNAGITFNTKSGEPEALLDGVTDVNQGCSTISDNEGNLLFYTSGGTVWNRLHRIMTNGDYIFDSTYYSPIIVPKPGANCIYYIFYVETYYLNNDSVRKWSYCSRGLNYSIVDLSLENGLGAVTEKKIHLLDSTRQIAAVGHKNGKDVWVVTQDIKEKCFVSYLLTENGLISQPVKSPNNANFDQDTIGYYFELYYGGWNYNYNYNMKFSPDGKKLGFICLKSDSNTNINLYDFNSDTGEISNGIDFLNNQFNYAKGIEFSDNCKFIYVSNFHKVTDNGNNFVFNSIQQYNITSHNPLEIENSKIILLDTILMWYTDYHIWDWSIMQMGPNKKIYLSHSYYLSVINQPDLAGIACDFRSDALFLESTLQEPRFSNWSLPTVVQNYIPKDFVCSLHELIVCESDSLILYAPYHADAIYNWSGPLGFKSSEQNPVIINSKSEMSGTYKYTISRDGSKFYAGDIDITVNPMEKILFADSSELILCAKSYNLQAVENPKDLKISWIGINSNENVVTITQSGVYKVSVENLNGCINTATINIKLYTPYCEGDTIFLNSGEYKNAKYFSWTGPNGFESSDEKPIIPDSKANMSGDYNLRIIKNGMFEGAFDTIYTKIPVIVNLRPKILFAGIKEITLCQDSLELQAVENPEGCLFSWKGINSSENKAVIKNTGVYTVYVENNFGCIDSATIEIKKYNAELVSYTENFSFNELCFGSSETKDMKFTLKSDYDLAINNIYFKSNMFVINNVNNYLKTYKDNETFDLPISFKPSDAGEFTDTLVIESGEPCYYKKEIPVYGTSKALFQFSLPNIISEVGDYLMIPLNAGMTCPNSNKLNSDYEIEISFDKEYFYPDSVKFGNIIENMIVGQNRILKIKGATEFNEKKDSLLPINYIYGMALVGRKEIILLSIDSVNFTNKRYYPEFINGTLKIEGCVINIRPIQLFKPTKLSIAPNPTDGDIKMSVETQEQGSFKIEIFNIQGQSIYIKNFRRSNAGFEEFEFNYDTKEMGSGVYSVHLTSPWHIIREQLVIEK
jgi:hypothetical protein